MYNWGNTPTREYTFTTELAARTFMRELEASGYRRAVAMPHLGEFSYWHRSCCAFIVNVAEHAIAR